MSDSGIYIIRNLISGKVYIGSAVDIKARWRSHCSTLSGRYHINTHLQRAWSKNGPGAFEFKVLLYCEPVDLIHYEQTMIDDYRKEYGRDMLYNIRPLARSNLGLKHTSETKAKMSADRKGRTSSPEHRAKISAANKGRKRSPEHCAKLSARMKGNKIHEGYHHSAETRTKIGAASKGRKHTLETREKMSASMKGKKHSPEHCAKISAGNKGRIPWNKGLRMKSGQQESTQEKLF